MNPSLASIKPNTLLLESDPAYFGIKFNEGSFYEVREEEVKSHLVLLKVYRCIHVIPILLDLVARNLWVSKRNHPRKLDTKENQG